MTVWILTSEYNAYDQFGEYFREVYSDKPTIENLMLETENDYEFCKWLQESGGGRKDRCRDWDMWYNLRQVECK